LEREIFRLGVEVRLNTWLDEADILAEAPDAVIIATGSLPPLDGRAPDRIWAPVPGIDQPHVVSALDLLSGARRELGQHAMIVDWTGRHEAIAAMDWLIDRGVAVTWLTHFPSFSPASQTSWRDAAALQRFHLAGNVEILTRHELVRIGAGECAMRPRHAPTGAIRTIAADTVVVVGPNQPCRGLYDALRSRIPASLAGDALSPRDLQAAIADGRRAAHALAPAHHTRSQERP
jgi:hypothetical protein